MDASFPGYLIHLPLFVLHFIECPRNMKFSAAINKSGLVFGKQAKKENVTPIQPTTHGSASLSSTARTEPDALAVPFEVTLSPTKAGTGSEYDEFLQFLSTESKSDTAPKAVESDQPRIDSIGSGLQGPAAASTGRTPIKNGAAASVVAPPQPASVHTKECQALSANTTGTCPFRHGEICAS